MADFTKIQLTGSTNGRPIKVVAVATPGTEVHTMTGALGELWLYASNPTGASVELTLEVGGVTSPDDLVIVTIPAKTGLTFVLPGVPLDGSVVIRAFAGSANALNILGWENRIS